MEIFGLPVVEAPLKSGMVVFGTLGEYKVWIPVGLVDMEEKRNT